jgi:hypothetical protein
VGISHTVIAAVDIEPWGDPDGYFARAGIQLPDRKPASRRPAVADLRQVLSALDGYRVTIRNAPSRLEIDVTNPSETDWASLWIEGYAGDDGQPVDVYFHRGAEDLTLRIVRGLAASCGPFLVMVNNEVPRWVTG